MQNTISKFLEQLSVIKELIEIDRQSGFYNFSYFISCENDDFLNIDDLKNYTTLVKVKNLTLIKELIEACNDIIHFNDIEVLNLESREFEGELELEINQKASFKTCNDFYTIVSGDDGTIAYTDFEEKKLFLKEFIFYFSNITYISDNCKQIKEWLLKCYPGLKKTTLPVNNIIAISTSNFIRKLLTKVYSNDYSAADIINYIETKTTEKTKDIIIKEFIETYEYIECDFMLNVQENDIKEAISKNISNLPIRYISNEKLPMISYLIKDINGYKTIHNAKGVFTDETENTFQVINLNELMIDYFDGFFVTFLEGFEKIKVLKDVYLNYKHDSLNSLQNNSSKIEKYFTDFKKEDTNNKKYPAKIHALLYMLELSNDGNEPPINNEGAFIKAEIIKIGKEKCKDSGQSFYRNVYLHFKDVKKQKIKQSIFGKDWKKSVTELSNNNESMIKFINNGYTNLASSLS